MSKIHQTHFTVPKEMPWHEKTDWDTDIYTCPHCHTEDCVPAGGSSSSKVLVVAEFPGNEEIKAGRPMVGRMGGVLKAELSRLGIDLRRMRLCNLWLHTPNKEEDCFNYGVSKVIEEAKNKKAILLIGSDTVKYFCDKSVMSVNGLKVKSPYLSAPIIMACVQPAIVFHSPIGELRLALYKFSIAIKDLL